MRLIIETVDCGAISARHQVPVNVDRNLNGRVSELFLHVHDRLALLNQQQRERVAEVVEPHATDAGLLKDPVEHVADVGFVQQGSVGRREYDVRCVLSGLQGSFPRRVRRAANVDANWEGQYAVPWSSLGWCREDD